MRAARGRPRERPCPAHSTTLGRNGTGAVTSCICDAGFQWNAETLECDACPAGTFRSPDDVLAETRACVTCPTDHYSLAQADACTPCPACVELCQSDADFSIPSKHLTTPTFFLTILVLSC